MRYLLSAFGLSFLVLISGCLPEDEPRELFYEGYDNLYKTIDSQSRTGESVSSEAIWSPPVPPVAYYHGSLISPDRQYVATARDVDGSYDDSDLVIRHVDTGSEAVNTCAESDHYESQVWSQNSAYLAVINQCGSGDELMIIDVQGQVLVPAFIGTGLVWAPDGDNFVYRVGTRYYKNKISSLVPEALSTAGQIVTETPRWSPSGQFVAYVAKITDADEALYVHELATGVTQPVSMHRAIGGVEGFDWSVDSQWLAYIGEASNTEIENGSAIYMVSPQGDQHQIITQVFLHEDSGSLPEVMRLAWSPVQQQLAFTVQSCDGCEYDQQSDLYLVRPDTIAQKVNSHPFVSSYWPEMDLQGRPFSNSLIKSSWSPDGRYLSYIGYMSVSEYIDQIANLYVVDTATFAEKKINFLNDRVLPHGGMFLIFVMPEWSPDSQRIAYIGKCGGDDWSYSLCTAAVPSGFPYRRISLAEEMALSVVWR